MKAKQPTIQQTINSFVYADPFNALFVYEAINRHVQHVMHLKPEDHERSLVSLNLMQEIAQDWHSVTHPSK
jgi:uncharacterized membrane protein YkgB